jgi:hypothetical protein
VTQKRLERAPGKKEIFSLQSMSVDSIFDDLHELIYSHTPDSEQIKKLLQAYYPHAEDEASRYLHPLLHEAAEQMAYLGANMILWHAWNDEKFKPLFNSPNYVDRYGKRVWQRIRLEHVYRSTRDQPDFRRMRESIIQLCK